MTKSVYFSITGAFIVLFSCQTQSSETNSEEITPSIVDQISEDICSDPAFEKVKSQRDSLIHLFQSPINLVQMKKDIGFLSMGWSLDPKLLPEIPEGYE